MIANGAAIAAMISHAATTNKAARSTPSNMLALSTSSPTPNQEISNIPRSPASLLIPHPNRAKNATVPNAAEPRRRSRIWSHDADCPQYASSFNRNSRTTVAGTPTITKTRTTQAPQVPSTLRAGLRLDQRGISERSNNTATRSLRRHSCRQEHRLHYVIIQPYGEPPIPSWAAMAYLAARPVGRCWSFPEAWRHFAIPR